MPKLFLVLMIIFYGLTCEVSRAQTRATDDTIVIQKMVKRFRLLLDSNVNNALALSKETEKRAAKINYKDGVWNALVCEGKALCRIGHPDSAKVLFARVIKEAQEQKSRLVESKAHIAFAAQLQDEYSFQPAVDHLIQAEKLLKDTDPFEVRFDLLNWLAITHRKMKDYTGALKYFDILENKYFSKMDSLQRFMLHQNKGNVYAVMKQYDKAEEFFKIAYKEVTQIKSPANLALITYNLGALYYRQGRYSDAKEYAFKSLDAYQKIGNQAFIELIYRLLGAICYDEKEYFNAIKYYKLAMKIATDIKNPRALLGNYHNLHLAYWELGYKNSDIATLKKALTYYQKYNQLTDSLYKVDTSAKILELEKKYETEKKNTQIAMLEKENQHQEDQIRVQKTQQNFLLWIFILVCGILGIFIYFFYYNRKVNKLLKLQRKRILNQKNQIEEKNAQLQKSMDTQNKLFSIIAHDLRSPLASIFNISSLIGFYIKDENYEALGSTVKMMDQKTDQILELTDNLLNWARSQTDSLQPMFAPVSLNTVLKECFKLYQPIASDKNITIDCPGQEELLVWADWDMVKTVCRNLINNAIKFTHQNGRITVWRETADQFVRISVKDTGIGMDETKLKELFEIGREKIERGTAGEKSSGLGLSVCREFIDAMNGRIWAESEKGVGSKFCFELLLYNPEIHVSKHKLVSSEVLSGTFAN